MKKINVILLFHKFVTSS